MRRDNNILEDLICPTLSQSASLSLSLDQSRASQVQADWRSHQGQAGWRKKRRREWLELWLGKVGWAEPSWADTEYLWDIFILIASHCQLGNNKENLERNKLELFPHWHCALGTISNVLWSEQEKNSDDVSRQHPLQPKNISTKWKLQKSSVIQPISKTSWN